MDRHICYRREGRRLFVWLSIVWIFCRAYSRPYRLALGEQEGKYPAFRMHGSFVTTSSGWRTSRHLDLHHAGNSVRTPEHIIAELALNSCSSLEITVWFVPSLVGNAVAVVFIGLFMGPIYPIVMNISGRIIPHWLMSGAVGWIAGLDQAGSAILPFVTGAMASKLGVTSLQPL